MQMYSDANRFDRMEALRLWTVGSSWFSSDEGKKGALVPGQLADLAVLSADFFSIPEEQIKSLQSVLTMVGGKTVHAAGEFAGIAPPAVAGESRVVAGRRIRRLGCASDEEIRNPHAHRGSGKLRQFVSMRRGRTMDFPAAVARCFSREGGREEKFLELRETIVTETRYQRSWRYRCSGRRRG